MHTQTQPHITTSIPVLRNSTTSTLNICIHATLVYMRLFLICDLLTYISFAVCVYVCV